MKIKATSPKPKVPARLRRRDDTVTASAADTIIARIAVAYAPVCALTSARKSRVMRIATAVYTITTGRTVRPPLGGHAIPGQVARNDVDQAGHRSRPREPQDEGRSHVAGVAHPRSAPTASTKRSGSRYDQECTPRASPFPAE